MRASECPNCGSDKIVTNITVRWNQSRGVFLPERGNFCTACGKPFHAATASALGFQTVRVRGMTRALWKLQQSADLVVVRHRNGVTEVLF